MLYMYDSNKAENPHQIFKEALANNIQQTYMLNPTKVNQIIQTHVAFLDARDQHLTVSQTWQGLQWKANRPHLFTSAIVAAVVIPESRQKTAYGETFDRVSIQPSWLTGNLIIVKEETHIDKIQNKVVFLGKPIDVAEAKEYLINALLDEHFIHHSPKTVCLFNEMDLQNATHFLNIQFENLFTNEQAPLFHVEHGVIGEENDPIETWKLVRLTGAPESELEQSAVENLRTMIANSPNVRMYQQTIKEMAQVEKKKLVF